MKKLLQILSTLFKRRKKSGIKYVCPKCQVEEIIPHEAIEYCDAIDPERLLYGPACFRCENCGYPYMQPEHYKAIVKGYGLYEGMDYTIESKSKSKNKR